MDRLVFPSEYGSDEIYNYKHEKQTHSKETFQVTVSWCDVNARGSNETTVKKHAAGSVIIENATADWTLAYFAVVLSASIRKNKSITAHLRRHTLFACVSKGSNVVLCLMRPTAEKRFCKESISFGEFGITGECELQLIADTTLKGEKLETEKQRLASELGEDCIGIMSQAKENLEASITLLQDQHAALLARQRQCEGILADQNRKRDFQTKEKKHEEGTGLQLAAQCARVVENALLKAVEEASKTSRIFSAAGNVDDHHVAVHFQGRWHLVRIVKRKGDSVRVPKTCLEVAECACKFFQQQLEGVMLHEMLPPGSKAGSSPAIWANSYLIEDAIKASQARYFGMHVTEQYDSSVSCGDGMDVADVVKGKKDRPLVRLRRRRERLEWIVVMFMMVFTVIWYSFVQNDVGAAYLFNAAMEKMLLVVEVNDVVLTNDEAGNLFFNPNSTVSSIFTYADMQAPIEMLEVFDGYYTVTDNGRIPKVNRILVSPEATQYRSVAREECHATQLLNAFQGVNTGTVYYAKCPMCAVSCQGYYDDNTMSAEPYWNHEAPYLFEKHIEMASVEGRFSTYGTSGFPITIDYLKDKVEGYFLNCGEEPDGTPGCYQQLQQTWLDANSRAFVVSYPMYNKNLNMVEKSTLVVEISLAGTMTTRLKSVAAQLRRQSYWPMAVVAGLIAFCTFCLLYIDVTTTVWGLLARSDDPKAQINFLFYDSIQVYMNVAIYILFVYLMALESQRVALGSIVYDFMHEYILDCNSISCDPNTIKGVETVQFDSDFVAYLALSESMKTYGAMFIAFMWAKMALQVVTGFPLLKKLSIRLAFKIVSFMIVMAFITGGVVLLLFSSYGDYLYEASTLMDSIVLALLVYVGTYDFDAMSNVDPVVTVVVILYLFFFPLLLYNLSISVMVVELPWVMRNLQASNTAITITYTSEAPGKCECCSIKIRPQTDYGRRRIGCYERLHRCFCYLKCRMAKFHRGRKGYCGCLKIQGNGDIENPFIWAIKFSRIQNENGEHVHQSSCNKFWTQFVPGYQLEAVAVPDDS